jgi:hypothetical protein
VSVSGAAKHKDVKVITFFLNNILNMKFNKYRSCACKIYPIEPQLATLQLNLKHCKIIVNIFVKYLVSSYKNVLQFKIANFVALFA